MTPSTAGPDSRRDTPPAGPDRRGARSEAAGAGAAATGRTDVDLLRLHAEYCKVVANEHRLAILYALDEGERSVGELAQELGLTMANVSQHLRVMKARGLVSSRRDGRTVFYSVANEKLVAACRLIREALVEQHLINEAIILGEEPPRGSD